MTLPKGPGRQGLILQDPLLTIMYTSEIGFLLTATSGPPVRWWRSVVSPLPCFQQHRCHSVNEPDHEAPKKTWKSTNRLRVNLSIIQFNRPGILQQLAKLDLDVIASLLLQLSFPLFSMTLELCCAKTRAHPPSSDSPPLPWFIVITHFCSLVYCQLHSSTPSSQPNSITAVNCELPRLVLSSQLCRWVPGLLKDILLSYITTTRILRYISSLTFTVAWMLISKMFALCELYFKLFH